MLCLRGRGRTGFFRLRLYPSGHHVTFVRIAISDYCPRDVCSGNRCRSETLALPMGTSALAIHSSAGHQLDHGDAGGRVSACQHTSRICEVCTRHPDNRVLLGHDHGLQATKDAHGHADRCNRCRGRGAQWFAGLGWSSRDRLFPWLSAGLGSGAGVDRCSFFGNGCGCAPRFLGAWPVRTRVATSWRDELASAGVRRLVGRADCPACRGSGSAKGHSRAADAACLG